MQAVESLSKGTSFPPEAQPALSHYASEAIHTEGMLLLLPKKPVGLILFSPGSYEDGPVFDLLLSVFVDSGLAVLLEDFTPYRGFGPQNGKSRRFHARAEAISELIGGQDLPL